MKRFIDEQFSGKNYSPTTVEEIEKIIDRTIEEVENVSLISKWADNLWNDLIHEKYKLSGSETKTIINSIKSSYTPVPPQLYLGNPLAKLEYLLYSSKILDVIESDGKEKLEREFLKTASEISEEIMNSINRDVTVEDYSEQYGENLKYFFENFA